MVLGDHGYTSALSLLSEAAVSDGLLGRTVLERYRESEDGEESRTEDVLYVLEHDGYLEECTGGYRFVSGLLEDWWRTRHGQRFTSITRR